MNAQVRFVHCLTCSTRLSFNRHAAGESICERCAEMTVPPALTCATDSCGIFLSEFERGSSVTHCARCRMLANDAEKAESRAATASNAAAPCSTPSVKGGC